MKCLSSPNVSQFNMCLGRDLQAVCLNCGMSLLPEHVNKAAQLSECTRNVFIIPVSNLKLGLQLF